MSLMTDLIETYDNVSGNEPAGMPKIAPVGHQYGSKKKVIDVCIDLDGHYVNADVKDNCQEKTVLAVTEESASRVSKAAATTPHALNDGLMFMSRQYFQDKTGANPSFMAYMEQLSAWCDSTYSCEEVKAVHKYLMNHDLVGDLIAHDKLKKDKKGGMVDVHKYEKYTVRWLILHPEEEQESKTWKNERVLRSWSEYYQICHKEKEKGLDGITGQMEDLETLHPKAVSAYGNSKLISTATKEDSTLHFKGERFTDEQQILQVGYESSQKMHNALTWLIDTQGIPISKNSLPYEQTDQKPKYIVCWSPEKNDTEGMNQLELLLNRKVRDDRNHYRSYKDCLKRIVFGLKQEGTMDGRISLLMTDRSGDGRFSIVMYRSFTTMAYLEKLKSWYEQCHWYPDDHAIEQCVLSTPSLFQIAQCAYGVERNSDKEQPYLDVNDAVFKDTVSVLLSIIFDGRRIPDSLIRRLAAQASAPERFAGNDAYKWKNWKQIVFTACAMIHYRHTVTQKEKGEKDLALDRENADRSYLFGRLLAVADRIENSALNKKSKTAGNGKVDHRDTNAMRMWSTYAAHPFTCYENLRKCIAPYLSSLGYGSREFYQNEIEEIMEKLGEGSGELNRPLEPEYLLGFYLERAELRKFTAKTAEENTDHDEEGDTL